MTKEKFLKETGMEDISGSHFEEINYIYTFHPSISETKGKKTDCTNIFIRWNGRYS